MKESGALMIARERDRHQEEGWDSHHDDAHDRGELVEAAITYLFVDQSNVSEMLQGLGKGEIWPFEFDWFKPFGDPPDHDPFYKTSFPQVDKIRCLTKAGALIAAEIDRLKRKEENAYRNA